jgi:hypothetical protein
MLLLVSADLEIYRNFIYSGFSFNVPTQNSAFEAGDNRKVVAILDFKDWAKKQVLPYGKGMKILGI